MHYQFITTITTTITATTTTTTHHHYYHHQNWIHPQSFITSSPTDSLLPPLILASHTESPHGSPTMSNQTQEKTEPSQQPQQQNPPVLEEDDEFEDFPVEDWDQEEAEKPSGSAANGNNEHLWEESWDDDDAAEDFSNQLKEELKKVNASH